MFEENLHNLNKENEAYLKTILNKGKKIKILLNLFFYVFYALAFLSMIGSLLLFYKQNSWLFKGIALLQLLIIFISTSLVFRLYYLQTFNIIERENLINEVKRLSSEIEYLRSYIEKVLFFLENEKRKRGK